MIEKKYEQEIEIKGHLIDSMILTRIFDNIMDLKGDFQVLDFNIGKKKKMSATPALQFVAKVGDI